MEPHESSQETNPSSVELPRPTQWPVIFAFGLTLLFAGLLTTAAVSAVGIILTVAGSIGCFREVLPAESYETVPVERKSPAIVTNRPQVERMRIAPDINRARIPIETYPIAAGIRGGLAGGVAMAVLAVVYGLLSHGSIWYPINLLASIVYAESLQLPTRYLTSFHPALLLVALLIHLTASVLVGLLYGAMLPMFPRRPVLLGGVIGPIMWTGLLYTTLGVINPLLDQRIDWKWFVASQIGFGIVAGLVVAQHSRIRTRQFLPLAMRADIEAPGIMDERNDGGGEQ